MSDVNYRLDDRISEMTAAGQRALIAIDGNSGAGKTTFAALLSNRYDCNVFHMDDFFLRPQQRTAKRMAEPGGNVDYERFLEEVLIPIGEGKPVVYRRYDCKKQMFLPSVRMTPKAVNIVEGAYALHPALRDYYNICIFLSVSPEEQIDRIRKRNGEEQAEVFRRKWIVLENFYFDTYHIKEKCDYIITT